MRKWLLITTALVAIGAAPVPARADPVTTSIGLAIGGALGGSAFAVAAATAFAQLAVGMVLNYAVAKVVGQSGGGASQAELRRDLSRPTALPAYRYVYGYCWAPGTPVGWTVKGENLYICYLLNSRPSDLSTHAALFDNRVVEISGDPFDFTDGGGAVGVGDPFMDHVRYWIGRGDQTTCPAQIVAESGYFDATDAWTGRTVLWAKLRAGKNDRRSERWPATPPALNVEGWWSLLYDPRDGVTRRSANQALVLLDALRKNPIRPYQDSYLWMETYAWAADVADELVTNKDATTSPRYEANGVLVWSDGSELEDQIEPLLLAGASRSIRVGGKMGVVPACWRNSVHTITDFTDGQAAEMTRWRPGDEIYTECVARYCAPDRAYEMAEAPAYVVPGAQAADGGLPKRRDLTLDFVADHRQAQRLEKIAAMRSRMQRGISWELFPDAFRLVPGSRCDVALPNPYTPWNGDYEAESVNPSAGINDDESITLRIPCVIRETSASVYAWDAATEEQDVEGAEFGGQIAAVGAPTNATLTTGGAAAITSGGTTTARVEAVWSASASASAQGYRWQWQGRAAGSTVWPEDWISGAEVDEDADLRGWISPAVIGLQYRVRIRTVGLYGESVWVYSDPVIASGPGNTVAAPSILLAVGGANRVDLTLRQADDAGATQIEVWGAASDSIAAASLLAVIAVGASVTVAHSDTGIGSAVTRYYWARARDDFGNASGYTASATATTT